MTESRKALTEYREFEFGHEFPVLPSKQRAEHVQRPRGRNQCNIRMSGYIGRIIMLEDCWASCEKLNSPSRPQEAWVTRACF